MMRIYCNHEDCKAPRRVLDQSEESDYTGPLTETYYTVFYLSCGHQTSRDTETRGISW